MNLLETFELLEWGEFEASKKFWAAAKENIIETSEFRVAFKKELEKLGLWNLIDSNTGKLKDKGSYGEIKKALDADPNNWTLKALQKLWVLQFKSNAKTRQEIRDEERAAREEQARLEVERKTLDRETLQSKQKEVEEFALEIGTKFAQQHKAEVDTKLNKLNKVVKDIDTLSREILFVDNKKVIPGPDLIKLDCDLTSKAAIQNRWSSEPVLTLKVTILYGLNSWYFREVSTKVELKVTDIETDYSKLSSELTTVLETIHKAILEDIDNMTKALEATYKDTAEKVSWGRRVQADVDAGKPTDPNFSAQILGLLAAGHKKAEAEYASWASWKYDDGDSGAAYEYEKNTCLRNVALYLLECNWAISQGETELATWRYSQSTDDLYSALNKVFGRTQIDFEVIK